MIPADLHDFFGAAAGVAGALVGLLFVAITIAHGSIIASEGGQGLRVRASAALTAFTNALTVSLFALLPGHKVGWTAVSVSVVGLLFVAASILSLLRVGQSRPGELRDALFLLGLAITFSLQLFYGLRVLLHPRDAGSVDTLAVLVIVCFLIGIARAWELIGGPSFPLHKELGAIVRGSRHAGDESSDADADAGGRAASGAEVSGGPGRPGAEESTDADR